VPDAARTSDVRRPFDWAQYRDEFGRAGERKALLGEDAAEIRGLYDHWYAAFQPASLSECFMIMEAISDLIEIRRCRRGLLAVESRLIEETRNRWRAAQRQELEQSKAQLARDSGAAVAGLKQFALGCRWLIECWEAFGGLDDWTAPHERGAHHGLGSLADPHQQLVLGYYAARGSIGPGGDSLSAGAPAAGSPERLRAVMDWELPRLRVLYERLEVQVNRPAEDEAIAAALERDDRRAQLLHLQRRHQKMFERTYRFLLEHRDGLPPPNLPGLDLVAALPKPARGRRRSARGA
jgi:hypothetical protein